MGTVDLNDQDTDQLHILWPIWTWWAIGDRLDDDRARSSAWWRNGDLIYGRGTDDDKGPAVAAMMAMQAGAKELGLPLGKNVKLVLGTDEETGSRDIEHYYASHPYAPNSVTPGLRFPRDQY